MGKYFLFLPCYRYFKNAPPGSAQRIVFDEKITRFEWKRPRDDVEALNAIINGKWNLRKDNVIM